MPSSGSCRTFPYLSPAALPKGPLKPRPCTKVTCRVLRRATCARAPCLLAPDARFPETDSNAALRTDVTVQSMAARFRRTELAAAFFALLTLVPVAGCALLKPSARQDEYLASTETHAITFRRWGFLTYAQSTSILPGEGGDVLRARAQAQLRRGGMKILVEDFSGMVLSQRELQRVVTIVGDLTTSLEGLLKQPIPISSIEIGLLPSPYGVSVTRGSLSLSGNHHVSFVMRQSPDLNAKLLPDIVDTIAHELVHLTAFVSLRTSFADIDHLAWERAAVTVAACAQLQVLGSVKSPKQDFWLLPEEEQEHILSHFTGESSLERSIRARYGADPEYDSLLMSPDLAEPMSASGRALERLCHDRARKVLLRQSHR